MMSIYMYPVTVVHNPIDWVVLCRYGPDLLNVILKIFQFKRKC